MFRAATHEQGRECGPVPILCETGFAQGAEPGEYLLGGAGWQKEAASGFQRPGFRLGLRSVRSLRVGA